MKSIILVSLLMLLCVFCYAQTATVTYWVNISNAPNGTIDESEIIAYNQANIPMAGGKLVWVENYLGGQGGKYKSSVELPMGYPQSPVIIRCAAKRRWAQDWLIGTSEQGFYGGSSTYLPTFAIPAPPSVIVDPPSGY